MGSEMCIRDRSHSYQNKMAPGTRCHPEEYDRLPKDGRQHGMTDEGVCRQSPESNCRGDMSYVIFLACQARARQVSCWDTERDTGDHKEIHMHMAPQWVGARAPMVYTAAVWRTTIARTPVGTAVHWSSTPHEWCIPLEPDPGNR